MAIRYECPRCQNTFAHDGVGEDAFAECPNCGSLALPAGETTSTDSRVLRSVSGQRFVSDEGSSVGSDGPTMGSPGVFSALMSEGGLLDSGVRSNEGPTHQHSMPSVSDGRGAPTDSDDRSFEGTPVPSLRSEPDGAIDPSLDDDATIRLDENAGAGHRLPASLLLTRASMEGAPVEDPPTEAPPIDAPLGDEFSVTNGAGVAPSLSFLDEDTVGGGPPPGAFTSSNEPSSDDPSSEIPAPTSVQPPDVDVTARAVVDDSSDESLSIPPDLDLGDIDLGFTVEPAPAPRPAARPAARAAIRPAGGRPRAAPQGVVQNAANALTHVDATDEGMAISDDRTTELRLPASAEGGAMTLSELEGQLGGGLDVATLLAGGGGLSDEAFGALEQAFDEVARRPAQSRYAPVTAEDALRAGGGIDEISLITLRQKSDVPAPPDKPKAPPLRFHRRNETPHLELSAEAKRLAAIPIGADELSGPNAVALSASHNDEGPSLDDAKPAHLFESTDFVLRPTAESVRAAEAIPTPDVKAAAVSGKARMLDDRAPSSGLTVGRISLLTFVFLVVGVAVGAGTAPTLDDGPSARKLAEEQVADGNRFYDQSRFDDALGAYRAAISRDRGYAPAHRAKAAALAKQRRYDDAATAYEEYLAMEPDAVDAPAIKEILKVFRGEASP